MLFVEGIGNEALNQRRLQARQAVVTIVSSYAAAHQVSASGEQIGRVAGAILVCGLSQLLIEWLEGRIRVRG